MLRDNFFSINNEIEIKSENKIQAEISLDNQHQIYSGHFPGNPIVPGVCLIEIIKEILSEFLQRDLMLDGAKNIKFTAILNPNENRNVFVEISYVMIDSNILKVNSTIFKNEIKFLKFNGTFK